MNTTLGTLFLAELESEARASRECLERIDQSVFEYKPHEKSMKMGYLTQLVADMPRWITTMVRVGEIDFATWEKYQPTSTADMLALFDTNMAEAKKALLEVSDEKLEKGMFVLKSGDHILMNTPMIESIYSTLHHWVHHRGQLIVYMRLNNIAVPSIYGPSADTNSF